MKQWLIIWNLYLLLKNKEMLQLENLKIGFSHFVEKGVTEAFTIVGENELSTGVRSFLSKKDHYSREIGRRTSLAKLLKVLDIPKKERTKIWEAYRISPLKKGGKVKWIVKETPVETKSN